MHIQQADPPVVVELAAEAGAANDRHAQAARRLDDLPLVVFLANDAPGQSDAATEKGTRVRKLVLVIGLTDGKNRKILIWKRHRTTGY